MQIASNNTTAEEITEYKVDCDRCKCKGCLINAVRCHKCLTCRGVIIPQCRDAR